MITSVFGLLTITLINTKQLVRACPLPLVLMFGIENKPEAAFNTVVFHSACPEMWARAGVSGESHFFCLLH